MRIELRKWTLDDRRDLAVMMHNVDRQFLSDSLPYPYTEENAGWWIKTISSQDGKEGLYRAVLADDVIVGMVSIGKKADVFAKDAEISYLMLEEYESKGVMTEAVRQICELTFEELDVVRITAHVYEKNLASRKLLEKNEFVLEGTMRKAVFKSGELQDLCIYGKIKE